MEKVLDAWDPMAEDFQDRRINSYREGVGQDLQYRHQSDAPRNGTDGGYKPVTLYISNIPLEVDETALTHIFIQEGKVMKVSIPEQSAEKAAKFGSKIGFVTMENTRGAQAAIEKLHGYQLKNKTLSVKVKLSKEELTRKKENHAREEEYVRKFTTGRPNGNADGSHPRMQQNGASGSFARNHGPYGDTASVNGDLTVTLENGSGRRVQDRAPHYSGGRGAAASTVQMSRGAGRGGSSMYGPQTGHLGRSPASVAGVYSTIVNQCGACHKPATLRCQACKSVYYCNAHCQVTHWTVHKQVCIYEQRAPAPPVNRNPLLATPDFENMQVDVSEAFVENNQQYLREWIQAVDVRSEKSNSADGQGPTTRPKFLSTSTKKANDQGSKAGGKQGPGARQEGQPQPGMNRPSPRKQDGPGVAPFSGGRPGSNPPSVAEGGCKEPSQQYQGQQRPRQLAEGSKDAMPGQFQQRREQPEKNKDARPGQFQQGREQSEKNKDAMPGQFQQRREQPGPEQRRGGPGSDGDKPGQFRRNNENRNQQRDFQDSQRNSSGSEQEGPDKFKQQRGGAGPRRDGYSGPRDRTDQPRRDGQGPQQRRGGPNQFDGQCRDGQGPGQGQQQREHGIENNRPGQFQQRDGKRGSPKQNEGPNFKQQERGNDNNNNRNNNERSAPRNGPRSPPKPKEQTWKDKVPAAPLKETSPAAQAASVTSPAAVVTTPQSPALSSLADALELNKTYTAVVSHMDSPQSFWVQVVQLCAHILTAVAEVANEYTGRTNPASAAAAGQKFLSEFMGDLARVQVVSVAGKNVKVFYMDFGNSEDKQVSGLLPLPAEIADLPAAAIECSLQVVPASGTGWSADVVDQIRQLFGETEACTLIPLRKVGGVVEVSLVRLKDELDATSALLTTGLGMVPTAPLTPMVSTTPATPVVSTTHATPKVSTTPATANVSAPPQRVMVVNLHNTMEKLSVGQHLDLLLLDTVSPVDIFTRISSLEETFGKFSDKMMADYRASPEVPYVPVVGELVASRFSANQVWYRANVLEVDSSKEEASLFYVDFGNKESLPFKELRAIKPEYADVPIHGFHSAVGGISLPAGGQWNDEHVGIYVTCLHKYLHLQGEYTRCSVVVESIKDKVVWVDMVTEGLQQTLSEDLSQQMEGSKLPEPILPQKVPSSPSAATASAMPSLENSSPKQAQAASGSSSPATASGNLPVVLGLASLPLGESVVCGIQEIVSCQEFYVNQKEAEDNLNMLREKLNSFCGGSALEQPEAVQQVSKGNHVLVQFSADNEWYRGRVEQVSEDGKKCRVFFVDYGNAEDKDVASLKVLPPDFKQIPAQAITCKLAGVPPPVQEEVEVRFKSSCLQTEVNIKAVGKQDDERYFVEVSTLDNRSITGILGIQSGRKGAQRKQDSSRQPSSCAESRPASEGLATSALAAANTPTPVSPRQMSASPPCADVHVPLRRDCLQQEMFHSQDIMVTHVVNPHHFYVMTPDQNMAQHAPEGMVTQLQALNTPPQPLGRPPIVGELLCGLFLNAWYRCEVVEVMSPEVRVKFFDYGNEAVVDVSELTPLPHMLCETYPFGTFRCSLHGIKPEEGETWDEETISVIKVLLENQFFSLDVKSKEGDVHQVTLTKQPEDWDVGQKLLDSGKAVTAAPAQTNAAKAALLKQMQELQAKLAAMGDA